jgi:transposase InsO family protein
MKGVLGDRWAYERAVELDFSRPGKPTDNANVESFNGRPWKEKIRLQQKSSPSNRPFFDLTQLKFNNLSR